ncbi:hypothetical protein GF378_02880 [Candidatus Pacearchaeota archaeon]|nr:hypothetical protein [Candidatus Pacearchaeota archaeon]
METKKLFVPILAIVTVMFLVATVSAAENLTNNMEVKVDDELASNGDLSVIAGESVTVKVTFNSLVDASDVTVKAVIEGDKADSSEISASFDVEQDLRYSKSLTVEIPYELKDQVSDDVSLVVTVKKGSDYKTEAEYSLRVQRPSYNADVLSIVTPNSIDAGETIPVDVVLKNIGYNDLDDMYVRGNLIALDGVERSIYVGDLVSLEDEDDDDDTTTTSARVNLQVPYDAAPGVYTLEIEVWNDDLEVSKAKQLIIENDFPESVFRAGSDLLIVNPTEKLQVYRVVTPEQENFVTVPAGSSKAFEVNPDSAEYIVNVFNMNGEVVSSFTFSATEDQSSVASPVVVLTVILAIVFLVLLIVLVVLIGRKPERSEDFGESYY